MTRSVLGTEVMAFADAFDQGFVIKKHLKIILQRNVTIEVFTDSLSLFNIITKSIDPTKKRLLIDLKCAKNAYESGDIELIYFICF